ncbi:DUF1801 domain-containing protein [Kiloniella antarctica]|uniref:DUF1801 domain-containing protein n=1 Tax=Kiloniella antarctica TaxID=1550907 RepID=A0ABW5BGV1_9PROT
MPHYPLPPAVELCYKNYPERVRGKLLSLRDLILETAGLTEGVGKIEEALKWGQPSFLTPETKSGSTIRIDQTKADNGQYAIYFHCQTNLVDRFRELYPQEMTYGGNRSIIFDQDDEVPTAALQHCIAMALTYHLNK